MSATASPLETLLKRDRTRVAVAIGAIVVLAWVDLAWMAMDMDPPDAAMPAWTPGYFAAMFVMWAIMMAGMMMPSASPAILLFARLRRHAGHDSVAPSLAFAAGYLMTWTAFSLAATAAQWGLSEASILSAAMSSRRAEFTGMLFIAAGLYQFTALKAACLSKCRSPMAFLVERRRDGRFGPVVMGMDHGVYCVGCCWALMALLFAFGVMNLLWVAALAAFVLAEKLFPAGDRIAAVSGAAMVALGLLLFNL